jgi:hypothetical protein
MRSRFRNGFAGLVLCLLISGCVFGNGEDGTPAVETTIASGVSITKSLDTQVQLLPPTPRLENADTSVLDTINLAIKADLRDATEIEVCHLDCASYTPFLTINGAELIAALVESLDRDIPLRPHARCPAVYQLHFMLRDGQHHYFGYTCEMMTQIFLRGNQEFWGGQDAVAPEAFNELMLPLIVPNLPDR